MTAPMREGRLRGLHVRAAVFALALLGCGTNGPVPAPSPQPSIAPTVAASASAEHEAAPLPSASEAPLASASGASVEAPPVTPVTLEIPRDKKVYVVFGQPGNARVFVYLHGKCGDPLAFRAFMQILPARGTLVAMRGDIKCDGGQPNWSDDIMLLDKRIKKALEVVAEARGEPLDTEHLVAIGYSAGALRAESLSTRYPDRYPRVVLIGGPRAPKQGNLGKTEKILLMAGSLDVRKPLRDAAADFIKAGRTARFVEIPGAKHGEYGPEAEAVMSDALDWIAANDP